MRGMTRRNHPDAPAEFECAGCYQRFFSKCVEEISGQYYCKLCQSRLKADNVGFFEKMKATLRRSREEALLEHLRGMRVEAELVQYDVGSESETKREMVKLVAQDIDGIWVEDRSTYSEYVRSSLYYFHYLLLSRLGYKLAELAKEIEANTKEVKNISFGEKFAM